MIKKLEKKKKNTLKENKSRYFFKNPVYAAIT